MSIKSNKMSNNSNNFGNIWFIIIIGLSYGVVKITTNPYLTEHEIVDYPNITTKDCGLGYIPETVDDRCFEWHKFLIVNYEENSPYPNGRPARQLDVPFVVPLIVWRKLNDTHDGGYKELNYCMGTVINQHWVITGPDCIEKPCNKNDSCLEVEYVIYPGIKDFKVAINASRNHSTTKAFVSYDSRTWANLGMLKFEMEINLDNDSVVNSVCLPKQWSNNSRDENAWIAGFGYKNAIDWSNGNRTQTSPENHIHIGSVQILDHLSSYRKLWVSPYLNLNGQTGCIGAMGSPIFQYVNNRAVLIGINLNKGPRPDANAGIWDRDVCYVNKEFDRAIRFYQVVVLTRVSKIIDIINETILSNP